MLHLFLDRRPWFRAKVYGYGAGLPIAWQGWLFFALHISLIIGVVLLFRDRPALLSISTIAAALMPLPVYAAKTQGGWRWRWGEEGD